MLKINKVSIVIAMLGLFAFVAGSAMALTITGGAFTPGPYLTYYPGDTMTLSVTATGVVPGDVLTGGIWGPYNGAGGPTVDMSEFTLISVGEDTYSATITVPVNDVNGDTLRWGQYVPVLNSYSAPSAWDWLSFRPERPLPAPSNGQVPSPVRAGAVEELCVNFSGSGVISNVVQMTVSLVNCGAWSDMVDFSDVTLYRKQGTDTFCGNWTVPNLAEGNYCLMAHTWIGEYVNREWGWTRLGSFTVDNTPPVVTITLPGDGAMLPSAALPVSATVTDNVSVITSVDVTVSSGTLEVVNGLAEGIVFHPNTGMDITLTAVDEAGNVGSDTVYNVSQVHDMGKRSNPSKTSN